MSRRVNHGMVPFGVEVERNFYCLFALIFSIFSLPLAAQNQINTSVGYKVIVEIPVVNIGTSTNPKLGQSVEVYASGVTVDEITAKEERNIDHAKDETQFVKRIFYVAPNSDIRIGVVNEYRFALGLVGKTLGMTVNTSVDPLYKWGIPFTYVPQNSITTVGTPSNVAPDRGFVMTFRTPSEVTPSGSKFEGKTMYKDNDIVATLTLRIAVTDIINGRQVLSKGIDANFKNSAVGMSFGNPIELSSFQDLLGLQGLIRMYQEGADYSADCYGYYDAMSGATQKATYQQVVDHFKTKGIDFSRVPATALTNPKETSEFFASQYYCITQGITLPSSYSGLGQPPMKNNGATSLTDLVSKINTSKIATPFIGFIECGPHGSVSMQYHDATTDPYYKLYGFLKLFGDNNSLCVARNLKIQGLIDVNCSDPSANSGRIVGGLAAMLNGKNAFLINGVSALSADVSTGGEVISGGLVGYMYGDAAISSFALYDPATPPDALEEEFNHHLLLDNIGSQFRANSSASSTCLSGGIGYAYLMLSNGGISRVSASIEQGQLLSRAFTNAYSGGVVARLECLETTAVRGAQTRSNRGFQMRTSTENIISTLSNVYTAGMVGFLSGKIQLYNNALITSPATDILIEARDEYVECAANMYAGGYYGFVLNPTNAKLIFRAPRSQQDGKLNVKIVQNGYRSSTKAVGGVVAYGLPQLAYPSTPGYLFTIMAEGINLSIEEKSTAFASPARGSSYAGLYCGYPNRTIVADDFNRCDFTFTKSKASINSEFGSTLNAFKYYVGGLMGSAPLVTLEGLRLTLDQTHLSAVQNSFNATGSTCNVYAGGVIGYCGTSVSKLQKLTLTGRNHSLIMADQSALSINSEPFAGGIVGYSSGTSITDCTVQGELAGGLILPTQASYGLGILHFNRNNGNTPGVGGIVGMTATTVNSFDPDDPYNTTSTKTRPCLMARCKVDKVYIYGYGYNKVADAGYDIMIGGLIGCARGSSNGSVAVLSEVTNTLIVGDGEDRVEVAVGGLSGTEWTGCSGTKPIYDRCLVRNCHIIAKGQNQWAAAAGISARRYADGITDQGNDYFFSNCMVLDTRIEVHTLTHYTLAGGIYGSSRGSTDKVRLESCFSNAEFLLINEEPSKIYFGGLAAGGYLPSKTITTFTPISGMVTAVNSFFNLQKAGTTDAWSRSTMSNNKGHELDFSNRYLITWTSLPVFNPKTTTGASNPNSSNLQQSYAGTYPYSSAITYQGGLLSNDTVMHESHYNISLTPPSWEFRRKTVRPRGSRVPAELWVSPWAGAPLYKLGEINRVVVTPDSVTQVTPKRVHLYEGIGITGHEFTTPSESRETEYNDPTPIRLTSYAEVEEDGLTPIDPNNYKDERRVIKWWYSSKATTDANGRFLANLLSGSLPVTFEETGYHLSIYCTDPILKDEVFYVQTSDFRETVFSVPVKITIRYIAPLSITINPIYGTRPERGTIANPFILLRNNTYQLQSVVDPLGVSNNAHTYSFSNVSPSSTALNVTAGGSIFTGSTPSGTTFKVSVRTIANRPDPFNSPATDEIWCKIASPVPVSIADQASSIGVASPNTVIDALSSYSFRMNPIIGYTFHTALRTPKNVKIKLKHTSGEEVVSIVTEGVVDATQKLLQIPSDFDWTVGDYSLNPIELSDQNALNPITEIVLDFEYYKQINVTFDHNDGSTFYVYTLHEGGRLDQIPGIDMDTEPGLNPNFPGLAFKGWLEQRAPTVEFTSGYDIDKPFTASLRLYAILALEFKYAVTHDSYVAYVNSNPALSGALSPPTLFPSERMKPTFGIVKPEALEEVNYVNLDQVPIVLGNGVRINVYLSANKPRPNNVLFYTGVTTSSDFSSGKFEPVTFAYEGQGVEDIHFSSGTESFYYYTYYIPYAELIRLQAKGRLYFVFDNMYKVVHQTMGVKPIGASEGVDVLYHRDELIAHSPYPKLANHVYVGWKGNTTNGAGGHYQVGDLMPEHEVVLRGKWAVAQVKPNATNHFYVDNITDQTLYDHLFLSLNQAYASASDGDVVQLMAKTKEHITFDKKIVYDSKFTKTPESISANENKIEGTVVFAANPDADNRTSGSANVRLENDLLASTVGIQVHTFGNKAQIDYNGKQIKADNAFVDLSFPKLGTFEDFYAWYPLNLPFDSRVNRVTNLSGTKQMHPEEFGVAEYSGARRATYGIGNTPDQMGNDWLYIAPPSFVGDFSSRDLTVLSKYVGDDQVLKANQGYMVNNRRKSSPLRFHAVSATFGANDSPTVTAYSGAASNLHHGWNYLAQSLGTNAKIDATTLGMSSIIQVSHSYSSDIPQTIKSGKQEQSYLAIDLNADPDHVIAPYTNFFYQTDSDRSLRFVAASETANTRSAARTDDAPARCRLRLAAADGTFDHLFFSLSPDEKACDYRIGRDVLKMGVRSEKALGLWSRKNGQELCAIESPMQGGKSSIPLVLNVPKSGEYRLYLDLAPCEGLGVWLMKGEQVVSELTCIQSCILPISSVGKNEDYSLRLVSRSDKINSPFRVYGGDGALTVDGLDVGHTYTVVDIMGTVVIDAKAHASRFSVTLPRGVYVVSAAGQYCKVVVK